MTLEERGLYAPNAVIRRLSRESVIWALGGGCALLMQLAHPLVAAGVDRHSSFRQRPVNRLARTIDLMLRMVFGDGAEVLAAAREINQAHRSVQGVTSERGEPFPPGTVYSAREPGLLLWVHSTLVYTGLTAYEAFVAPITVEERYAFLSDFKRIGSLLGIPDRAYAPDWAAFEQYLRDMTEGGPVKVGPLSRRLGAAVLRPRIPPLPGFAFLPLDIVSAGLMPAAIREGYGLPWGRPQRTAYEICRVVLPRVLARTPPLVRIVPHARTAERRARIAA
jgi:uncharacterized protein (DUF2236 family)